MPLYIILYKHVHVHVDVKQYYIPIFFRFSTPVEIFTSIMILVWNFGSWKMKFL